MASEQNESSRAVRRGLRSRLANLLQVGVVLCLAAIFAGLLGKWHFAFDLASHFRIQAAATLLLASPLLLLLKCRRWAAVSLVAGCLVSVTLWPFMPGAAKAYRGDSLRLVSINVHTSNNQRDRVIEFIRQHNPDIVVLQETDDAWIESLDRALSPQWPYHAARSRADNFGIAIYSKLPWRSCEFVELSEALSVPSVVARFDLPNGEPLNLIGTHPLPPMTHSMWEARNSLFTGLAERTNQLGPTRTIVAGDLNCTPWSYWFGRLLRESRLENSAVGYGLNISWRPYRTAVLGLPIDHLLVGEEIDVDDRWTGGDVGSDHRPVVLDFR